MEIEIIGNEVTINYKGWEIGEIETYRQELAYNVKEQWK